MFWFISLYFNLRNTLPKFGTFLLRHPVYIYIYIHIQLLASAEMKCWLAVTTPKVREPKVGTMDPKREANWVRSTSLYMTKQQLHQDWRIFHSWNCHGKFYCDSEIRRSTFRCPGSAVDLPCVAISPLLPSVLLYRTGYITLTPLTWRIW